MTIPGVGPVTSLLLPAPLMFRRARVDPGTEMVLAESLGNERCKATRTTKGHCRAHAPAGGNHVYRMWSDGTEFRWTKCSVLAAV